jgi:nucleoside-triphosphatase
LVSGLPRSGKTTLVKKILEAPSIKKEAAGFFTEEFRNKGERIGFRIVTIPEKKAGILAQKGIPSPFRVGPYGVNIPELENLGCGALTKAKSSGNLIVVDEIGKMELLSETFRSLLTDVLDSPQTVLATIMERTHPFADRIKKRPDVRLFFLERNNFGDIFRNVSIWLDNRHHFFL